MFDMFKLFSNRSTPQETGSVEVTDRSLIKRFTDDPDFPYLISFPRTGSHWLRTLMELYFEKPSLVRAFYYKEATDFTCFHWHDADQTLERRSVLYLYRQPAATVYSQMNYDQENLEDSERVVYWSQLYGQHLKKWLITERFTSRKTVLTYERLTRALVSEFSKVCDHFGLPLDTKRLLEISALATKESLKEKTQHDSQVVNLSGSYQARRKDFQQRHAKLIMKTVFEQDEGLAAFFEANA
jgi:hypothetical protein